jgi:hypothetical protein
MNDEPLTCPYCNAAVPLRPGTAVGERVVCPRCGDTFTVRPGSAAITEAHAVTGVTAAPPVLQRATDVQAPARRSNRLVAFLVLGVMVVMATAGLTFALLTQKDRRAHDSGLTRRPKRSPVAEEPPDNPALSAVPPDRLAALGYLPVGTSLIAAARIPELAATPTGQELLESRIGSGGAEVLLSELAQLGGLKLDQVDHLALGIKLDAAFPPPSVLVIRTLAPYDSAALARSLQARSAGGSARKRTYLFEFPGRSLPLVVWFADDRTLVVALLLSHLKAVPTSPYSDLSQLPEEVRSVLKERRDPGSPLWAVGHARDWSKTAARPLLARLKKQDSERLSAVRTFAAWLDLSNPITVKLDLQCDDGAAARSLEESFVGPLRARAPSLQAARDGPWLTVQFQTDPEAVRQMLHR